MNTLQLDKQRTLDNKIRYYLYKVRSKQMTASEALVHLVSPDELEYCAEDPFKDYKKKSFKSLI